MLALKLNSRAAKTPVSMGSSRQLRRVIGKIFRMPPGESGVLTKRGLLSGMGNPLCRAREASPRPRARRSSPTAPRQHVAEVFSLRTDMNVIGSE